MNYLLVNIMFVQFNSLVRRYCGFSKLPEADVLKRRFYLMDFYKLHNASILFNSMQNPEELDFTDALHNRQEVTEEQVEIAHLSEYVTLKKLSELRYRDLPPEEQYRKFTVVDGEDWEIID